MKRSILTALSVLTLAACAEELPRKGETDSPLSSTHFTCDQIAYRLDENSGRQYVWREAPTLVLNNDTPVERIHPYDSREHTFNSSEFLSDDESAFRFVGGEQKVSVPRDIHDTDIECDSGSMWSYAEGERRQAPTVWSTSDIRVPPHSKLTLKTKYRYKALTAGYLLTLRGVEAGERITIEGRWSGLFLDQIDTDVTIDPLD